MSCWGDDLDRLNTQHFIVWNYCCSLPVQIPSIVINDVTQRFCQQCGRFHLLEAVRVNLLPAICCCLSNYIWASALSRIISSLQFDENKRSCRDRLQKHNARRRRKVKQANEAAEDDGNLLDSLEDAIRCANGGSFSKRKKKELGLDGLYPANLLDSGGTESSASGFDSQESLGAYFNSGMLLGRNSVNSSSPGMYQDMTPGMLTQSQQMLLDSLTSNLQTLPGRTLGRNNVNRSASQSSIGSRLPNAVLDRTGSLPKSIDIAPQYGLHPALQQHMAMPGSHSRLSSDSSSMQVGTAGNACSDGGRKGVCVEGENWLSSSVGRFSLHVVHSSLKIAITQFHTW